MVVTAISSNTLAQQTRGSALPAGKIGAMGCAAAGDCEKPPLSFFAFKTWHLRGIMPS